MKISTKMAVTRSEGRGHKTSTEQTPSSSEVTAATSATGTIVELGTATTATGTTATESTEQTATASSATRVPSAVPSSATAMTSANPSSVTLSAAPTLPVEKQPMKPPTWMPAAVTDSRTAALHETDTSTVRRAKKIIAGLPEPCRPRDSHLPSKKGGGGGSAHSRTKAHKIAKAKEELLRLQVELAAARLAALETEDTEDEEDNISVYTKTEGNDRVGDWLENQANNPVLAITSEPHVPMR